MTEKNIHETKKSAGKEPNYKLRRIGVGLAAASVVVGAVAAVRGANNIIEENELMGSAQSASVLEEYNNGTLSPEDFVAFKAVDKETPYRLARDVVGNGGDLREVVGAIVAQVDTRGNEGVDVGDTVVLPRYVVDIESLEQAGIKILPQPDLNQK